MANYYYLKKDEIIQEGDEVEMSAKYNDDAKWQPAAHTVGTPAPDPQFMAHRVYRRLIVDNGNPGDIQSEVISKPIE